MVGLARYRIIVDRATCISCGAAPAACPEIYELGSDNFKNRVVERYSVKTDDNISIGEIPEELYECAKAGADVCPVSAIKIERID
ncbi:MAG: ferredoxin [Ignisphaera sp.]